MVKRPKNEISLPYHPISGRNSLMGQLSGNEIFLACFERVLKRMCYRRRRSARNYRLRYYPCTRENPLRSIDMAMGQDLRYLFSRDYHLFKRFFKGHRGFVGVLTHSHIEYLFQ